MAAAASLTNNGVGATAPKETRALAITPRLHVRLTATPTTAISISVLGINLRYASPDLAGRLGNVIASTISPLASEVWPGPVTIFSTATERRLAFPTTTAFAPAAIIAGTLSAAGDALQRLPTIVHRP